MSKIAKKSRCKPYSYTPIDKASSNKQIVLNRYLKESLFGKRLKRLNNDVLYYQYNNPCQALYIDGKTLRQQQKILKHISKGTSNSRKLN